MLKCCNKCNYTGIYFNEKHFYELCDCVIKYINKLEKESDLLNKKLEKKEEDGWEDFYDFEEVPPSKNICENCLKNRNACRCYR